jgi:hypothetical protein
MQVNTKVAKPLQLHRCPSQEVRSHWTRDELQIMKILVAL